MALSRTASAVLAALLLAAPAVAAEPQLQPGEQAMQQMIMELTGEKLQWQTQAIALQRQVDDLTKQLSAAKAPAPEPAK